MKDSLQVYNGGAAGTQSVGWTDAVGRASNQATAVEATGRASSRGASVTFDIGYFSQGLTNPSGTLHADLRVTIPMPGMSAEDSIAALDKQLAGEGMSKAERSVILGAVGRSLDAAPTGNSTVHMYMSEH